jgi:hypothetical protein
VLPHDRRGDVRSRVEALVVGVMGLVCRELIEEIAAGFVRTASAVGLESHAVVAGIRHAANGARYLITVI